MDKRSITKKGIKYQGKNYVGDFLKEYHGHQALVAEVKGEQSIRVYLEGKYIGTATELHDKEGLSKGSEEMFGLGKKLEDYKTEEIVKELVQRKGTSILKMKDGQQYQVKGNGSRVKEWGPATVFVIRD